MNCHGVFQSQYQYIVTPNLILPHGVVFTMYIRGTICCVFSNWTIFCVGEYSTRCQLVVPVHLAFAKIIFYELMFSYLTIFVRISTKFTWIYANFWTLNLTSDFYIKSLFYWNFCITLQLCLSILWYDVF